MPDKSIGQHLLAAAKGETAPVSEEIKQWLHHPKAQEILKQTSTEVHTEEKAKREISFAPWPPTEVVLNLIAQRTNKTEIEIFKEIGLSSSSLYDAKRSGKCRLVTKFALEGYLAKLTSEQNPPQVFDFDELTKIFHSLLFQEDTKPLLKKIAGMLTNA